MIFRALEASNAAGELLLLQGGFCRWHVRKDRSLTIYEILSQRPGAGQEMLAHLRALPDIRMIRASCPDDLPHANAWYARRGFQMTAMRQISGGSLNVWTLSLE
jgi:hypothetical protein